MKTGIIGLGKMGGALLRGMLKAGAVSPEEVWVYDHHHENVQALQKLGDDDGLGGREGGQLFG